MRFAIHLAFLLALAVPAESQSVRNTVVELSATVSESPPLIQFTWPANPTDAGYSIYRRLPGETTWVLHASADTGAVAWTDSVVVVGVAYEYRFEKHGLPVGRGDATAGIHVPPVHDRGKLILLVADNHAVALSSELARLERDLIGDGWQVIRHDVSPAATVPDVKALIDSEYQTDPARVDALFLFGDLAVPYSGQIAYDGHSNHGGAWPSDGFYADMDGLWTDLYVTNTSSSRTANHNVPDDGKYDQFTIVDRELAVGRVDLADMPAFAAGEEALLRAYLDKNHAYRQKLITVQERAVVDDNFGYFGGEAFAATMWRSGAPMFGAANVTTGDYFTTLNTTSGPGYLWSYGCGGGTYTSAGGVGSTTDFTTSTNRTIFTMLFGSYHGDWDSPDNFMRASLCSGWTLSCAWAGRPAWTWSSMALGYTLGHAARWSQNDPSPRNGFGARGIHMGLMGDPSLRMHMLAPPADLVAVEDASGTVDLSWTGSPDAGLGYYVSRAASEGGPYTVLTAAAVPGNNWNDPSPLPGLNHYMVRAASLQTSNSGSYVNLSQGAMGSVQTVVSVGSRAGLADRPTLRLAGRNPMHPPATIEFVVPRPGRIEVSILDVQGREVRRVVDRDMAAGTHTHGWDGRDLRGLRAAPGIYFAQIRSGGQAASIKFVVVQ